MMIANWINFILQREHGCIFILSEGIKWKYCSTGIGRESVSLNGRIYCDHSIVISVFSRSFSSFVSFLFAFASICRILSRVTPKIVPTSSSV